MELKLNSNSVVSRFTSLKNAAQNNARLFHEFVEGFLIVPKSFLLMNMLWECLIEHDSFSGLDAGILVSILVIGLCKGYGQKKIDFSTAVKLGLAGCAYCVFWGASLWNAWWSTEFITLFLVCVDIAFEVLEKLEKRGVEVHAVKKQVTVGFVKSDRLKVDNLKHNKAKNKAHLALKA